MKEKFDIDDKDLVIVAVFIIAIVSMIVLKDGNIILSALTGLFGITTGKALK